jgi:hypothetical protein
MISAGRAVMLGQETRMLFSAVMFLGTSAAFILPNEKPEIEVQ